ncbi:zinc ribbon domain-containing protein [Selenihalanaerobacter shriftii]
MVNTEVDFCSNCGNELTSERKQTCYNCDSVIEEYARFCPECGVELVMSCPECETELDPKTKFCSNCGFNFESDNNDDRGSEEETGP